MGRAMTVKPRRLSVVRAHATTSDADALARVARGDVGALGEVYDRHARELLRFASRTAGASDAPDVVQSTFLRAAKVAGAYDGRAPTARAWLFGIAVRVMQERRRSVARFARALMRFDASVVVMPVHAERSDLEKALSRLAEAKRVVLVLAEVEGFTCEEIATMLGVPVGTVWTRLHHARKQLRAFFDEGSP
ncbi:MAG: polymerase sigma-54 factor RpoN [Labilithrix sp.]|nr:polymerase sigma-54 factor RpoN [Labilithrix sp.]